MGLESEAVPVLNAQLGDDRVDFELECGHVLGLARSDAVSKVKIGPEAEVLTLPTALVCPVCVMELAERR